MWLAVDFMLNGVPTGEDAMNRRPADRGSLRIPGCLCVLLWACNPASFDDLGVPSGAAHDDATGGTQAIGTASESAATTTNVDGDVEAPSERSSGRAGTAGTSMGPRGGATADDAADADGDADGDPHADTEEHPVPAADSGAQEAGTAGAAMDDASGGSAQSSPSGADLPGMAEPEAAQPEPMASPEPDSAPSPTPRSDPTPPCPDDAYPASNGECVPAGDHTHLHANLYAFWDHAAPDMWNIDQELKVVQKAASTFWALNWTWQDADFGGYLGLQTDGDRFGGARGELAIFSLWNAVAADGGNCQPFGGEGEGFSCRLPFSFLADHWYRLRLWRLEITEQGQWWGAWVIDDATGEEYLIGNIAVSAERLHVGAILNFSEYFGSQVACDAVPTSTAAWTAPQANFRAEGSYQYDAQFARSSRGICTGGKVETTTFADRMNGSGVQIIQGGAL